MCSKNIEYCILKRNELIGGRLSRHFKVDIKTWYNIEDATGLRAQIIDLLFDLNRKLEMLEMNNQAVAVLAHKEKNNDEVTELKIKESNNTSVVMSDQKGKDRITKKKYFYSCEIRSGVQQRHFNNK